MQIQEDGVPLYISNDGNTCSKTHPVELIFDVLVTHFDGKITSLGMCVEAHDALSQNVHMWLQFELEGNLSFVNLVSP